MHADGHEHPVAPRRRLLGAMSLTGVIMLAEVVGGLLSGSLALLADAGHMLTDLLALGVAFTAMSLAGMPANARATYGYRRLEILAALVNGVLLVVLSASIAVEAIERWRAPQPIDLSVMATVALIGLAANMGGLWLLRGHGGDLNLRGAFLHVAGDALTSVGVLVGAAVIAATGWQQVDAVISGLIALAIVATSVSLLRDVVGVLLEAAPRGIDTNAVRLSIGGVQGVAQVHDLHVWSITTGVPALSAHVVLASPGSDPHAVRVAIRDRLRAQFRIDHATLQIEPLSEEGCGCP